MDSRQEKPTCPKPARTHGVAYGVVPHMRIRINALSLIILVFIVASIFLVFKWINSTTISSDFVGLVCLFMIFVIIFLTFSQWLTDRMNNGNTLSTLSRQISEDDSLNESLARQLFAVENEASIMSWNSPTRWLWKSLMVSCETLDIEIPMTIASRTHRQVLEEIQLTEDMLEPETILKTPHVRSKYVITTIVWCLILLVGAIAKRSWLGIFFCLLTFCGLGLRFPIMRDILPSFGVDESSLIASMGFLEDKRGRLWTVDDSLMIISGGKENKQPVIVHVVGPSGWLTMTYTNAKDPDFIKLWQRWNHPDPRPELAPPAQT